VIKVEGTLEDFSKVQVAVHEKLNSVVNSSHITLPDPIKANAGATIALLLPNRFLPRCCSWLMLVVLLGL
jgi:hypothetical protein